MPADQYEKLDDTVLAWKRRQKLGRFDPNARSPSEMAEERRATDSEAIRSKGVEVGKRCRVGGEDTRRGTVRYVGEIEGLGGEREAGCIWVGIELDEPLGRNDGTVKVEVDGKQEMRRVFECQNKFGVFARPEKLEVGDWPPLDDLDDDMEEL